LRFIPGTATLIAYADIHEIMLSDLRQKARLLLPMTDDPKGIRGPTGINIETDIDHVVAGVVLAQHQVSREAVSCSPAGASMT